MYPTIRFGRFTWWNETAKRVQIFPWSCHETMDFKSSDRKRSPGLERSIDRAAILWLIDSKSMLQHFFWFILKSRGFHDGCIYYAFLVYFFAHVPNFLLGINLCSEFQVCSIARNHTYTVQNILKIVYGLIWVKLNWSFWLSSMASLVFSAISKATYFMQIFTKRYENGSQKLKASNLDFCLTESIGQTARLKWKNLLKGVVFDIKEQTIYNSKKNVPSFNIFLDRVLRDEIWLSNSEKIFWNCSWCWNKMPVVDKKGEDR